MAPSVHCPQSLSSSATIQYTRNISINDLVEIQDLVVGSGGVTGKKETSRSALHVTTGVNESDSDWIGAKGIYLF
jgi:hypothetical protein